MVFTKMRLASLVVFSSTISYVYAAAYKLDVTTLILLTIGGFLITAAANGMNQIIEKDSDKLMKRTQDRPLATGKMSVNEGLIVVSICGIVGVFILGFYINPLSGLLAAMAIIMYAGIYTPMKRKSSWAVIVGAFPGAMPPLLGYVAYSGEFGLVPGVLFLIQFAWQLPHFWSIAWKLDEDYRKGGFILLPINGKKDDASAWLILLSSIAMIPVGLIPYYIGVNSIYSAVIITILALFGVYFAFKLLQEKNDAMALKVMFASFLYLPVTQLALTFDRFYLV